MNRTCLIVLLCSLVLSVGIIAAGCVQNAGSTPVHQTGTATPSVPGTEQPETPAPIQQPGFQTGSYAGQDQNSTLGNGQRVQQDLVSAASELGTTAQQFSDALGIGNATQALSGNLTEAAQNLGVTEQQLRTVLGIPSGAQTTSLPARQQS